MKRNLCLLAADDSPISVELYADQMKKGNPVILLNSRNSLAHLEQCMQKYQPMYVCVTAEQRAEKRLADGGYRMESEHAQYQIWRRASEPAWSGKLHPGLAVLLSTSGSTGSSKMYYRVIKYVKRKVENEDEKEYKKRCINFNDNVCDLFDSI